MATASGGRALSCCRLNGSCVCPAQPRLTLPSRALPSPAQPSLALPSLAQPCSVLFCPAQPSPALPCSGQPYPAQPSPAQPSPWPSAYHQRPLKGQHFAAWVTGALTFIRPKGRLPGTTCPLLPGACVSAVAPGFILGFDNFCDKRNETERCILWPGDRTK